MMTLEALSQAGCLSRREGCIERGFAAFGNISVAMNSKCPDLVLSGASTLWVHSLPAEP